MSSKDSINIQGSKFGGGIAGPGGIQIGGKLIDNSVNVAGDNAEKIAQLIVQLKGLAQSLPETHKQDAEVDLENLEEELQKDLENQEPRKIKRYLKGLIATIGAALVAVVPASAELKTVSKNAINTVENVRMLVEEVKSLQGSPVEFKSLPDNTQQMTETIGIFAEKVGELANLTSE